MLNTVVLLGLLITFVVGLLFLLRGYRSLRYFIAIYAFWLGASRVYEFLSMYAPTLGVMWTWIVAGGAGIVLAVLAFVFVKFTLFLTGGLLGLSLYQLASALNPVFFGTLSPAVSFLIGVIFFLVFGFLALAAKKFLIVLATSAWGAYTAVASAGVLIGLLVSPPAGLRGGTSLSAYAPYSIFAALPAAVPVVLACVLAVVGIIVQFRRGGKRRRR